MSDMTGQNTEELDIEQALDQPQSLRQQDVVDYLLDNPQFFTRNPRLLERLVIPHEQKGSVSLVELQGEQLRRKVRLLSKKLNQLIAVAKKNEQIYRIYADLNLRLLQCKDVAEMQLTLEEIMQDRLKLSAVSLKPFKGANAFPEIQQRLFIEKRFKQQQFFFGRLSQHERQLLFGLQPVESVALILLGAKDELGMLAIGSKDPGHFNPDMDTLLITQLQQFLNILLDNLLSD